MRFDPRLVGFGLFLVVAGGVVLAVRQGLVPAGAIEQVWSLWPLLLVGFGLSMILDKRPGASLGGLVVAVVFGIMAGGAISGGGFPWGICSGDDADGIAFQPMSGELVAGAEVHLEMACGDLALATTDGGGWLLDGTSEDGRGPRVEQDEGGLRIERDESGGFDIGAAPDRWRFALPREPRISLSVAANAGTTELDLTGADLADLGVELNAGSLTVDLADADAVGGLSVEVNAGSATIWLPDAALRADLAVNAGSIAICSPPDVGLRILANDNVAASIDLGDRGLVRVGDAWQTAGFAEAAVRIEIEADVNAGSVSLDADDRCST